MRIVELIFSVLFCSYVLVICGSDIRVCDCGYLDPDLMCLQIANKVIISQSRIKSTNFKNPVLLYSNIKLIKISHYAW